MVKIGLRYSKLILASCMLFMACGANFQQQFSKEVRSEIATTAKPKQELARKVLMEIGVAQRYDLYLGNSVDIVTSPTTPSKFNAWLQQTLAMARWVEERRSAPC